ncbi:hypothetical protein [Streptomyces sp. HUAS ZL42]|uniref:hypothetical protein n=1 Tax=Streptomyces sp. HUAS ZL42 TaxID=3231715 RepID=UPI00345E0DB3
MRYRTQLGYRVKVDPGLFKAYISCSGCDRGWKVKNEDADREANRHANSCRREPRRGNSPNAGVIGR